MKKKPNLLFFGIDSMRADHMSLYGYNRLTTPHMAKYLEDGVVFDNCYSPSIPTSPGYASMLTGKDLFSTGIVALRHKGDYAKGCVTLAEILKENGYNTTCIGFTGHVAARGFDTYLNFPGWGPDEDDGRAHKAEKANLVAIPEMERLAAEDKPFFLFLRHMDPHSPYLPPVPFDRLFYTGNEKDPENKSLVPVYEFKPFRDYFVSWFPEGCTDSEYVIAQYDGAVAYMDTCIQQILDRLEGLGIEEETLVVFTSDHGETLYDHDCYFDHHGLYDCTLTVPFAFRYKGKLANGERVNAKRFGDFVQLKDIVPTILDILDIKTDLNFDGRNLMKLYRGEEFVQESEMYITEATWMRKHGWRTPEWKLIRALEPDFHFKPAVELYNLIADPEEYDNVADKYPEVVECLTKRMDNHIAQRKQESGNEDPIYTNLTWHGNEALGRGFVSSEEAYNSMHIGNPEDAKKLQETLNKMGVKE